MGQQALTNLKLWARFYRFGVKIATPFVKLLVKLKRYLGENKCNNSSSQCFNEDILLSLGVCWYDTNITTS